MNLEVIKRPDESEQPKYKFSKEEKQQLEKALTQKIWKKFEYFALPTYRSSELYVSLERVYELFYLEYIKVSGLAYRDYEIDLRKFYKKDGIRNVKRSKSCYLRFLRAYHKAISSIGRIELEKIENDISCVREEGRTYSSAIDLRLGNF